MLSFISSLFPLQSANLKSVNELLKSWGNKPIVSCVLGISKVGFKSNLSISFTHSALLLLNKEIDNECEEIKKENGILIEFGDYNLNMCESERKNSDKGFVVYPYGDNGGLRYYVKKYGEFIEQFGDIGYINLNIDGTNQRTFTDFINNIAKVEDNKWIQKNYSVINFNSHNFVLEALKELKPFFHIGNIFPKDPYFVKNKSKKILDFIPPIIKTELIKFYKI